jgi:hypothetical protein
MQNQATIRSQVGARLGRLLALPSRQLSNVCAHSLHSGTSFHAFEEDLRALSKQRVMPNLMLMLLGNDHTAGTDPRYPTSRAAVADDDLALGRLVDDVSHSRFWQDTIILWWRTMRKTDSIT